MLNDTQTYHDGLNSTVFGSDTQTTFTLTAKDIFSVGFTVYR